MSNIAPYQDTLEEAQKLLIELAKTHLPDGEAKSPSNTQDTSPSNGTSGEKETSDPEDKSPSNGADGEAKDDINGIDDSFPEDSSSEDPPDLITYETQIAEADDVVQLPPASPQKKKKIGRNAKCPCDSGKKYKVCCLNSE